MLLTKVGFTNIIDRLKLGIYFDYSSNQRFNCEMDPISLIEVHIRIESGNRQIGCRSVSR